MIGHLGHGGRQHAPDEHTLLWRRAGHEAAVLLPWGRPDDGE